MTHIDTSSNILADRRIREWFSRQQALREAERVDSQPKLIPERSVITVSRQYGAGGHKIALLLAGKLEPTWQIWDREIVDAIAENANVYKEMVEALDERSHSRMDQILGTVRKSYPLSHEQYRNSIIQVMASVAHQGEKIIIGRGANFILPQALNVRLIASTDYRITEISMRESLTRVESAAKLRRIDAERAGYVRNLFNRDINDPMAYDLVLRMGHLSIDTAVACIIAALRQHQSEQDPNYAETTERVKHPMNGIHAIH